MRIETLEELTRVLQASISPVALISGVGLLILSQTNRFGRVTDRLRELIHERERTDAHLASLETQIGIFHRRARILRAAITCAVGCVLLAAVQVLFLFGIAVLDLRVHVVVLLVFACSLLSLIGSLGLFLVDMQLSLKAVQCELEDAARRRPGAR